MDNLQHHGIKGQKWGVRRYQNKDGSLTADGRKRYGSEDNFRKQYPEDVKKGLKTAKGLVDKGKDVNDKITKKAKEEQIKKDVSKMSDQELQKIVNRLNMEERYKQVMNSRAADDGKNVVDKILGYAGTAAVVGIGAVDLMIKIQELKGKK